MRKKILLLGVCSLTTVSFGYFSKKTDLDPVSNLALADIEAIAGCEASSGQDLSSRCNVSPNSNCYWGESVAPNCCSNLAR